MFDDSIIIRIYNYPEDDFDYIESYTEFLPALMIPNEQRIISFS